jgi:hypothetical protein
MSRLYWLLMSLVLPILAGVTTVRADDLPKPSPYPTTWELTFDHGKPTRIVVASEGKAPQAYWYLAYTVTNNTGQERDFMPIFEMVGEDGKLVRSDNHVSPAVIEAIKKQEGDKYIKSSVFSSGEIRLGETEAVHAVSVWTEPAGRMGHFSILVGGLNGEYKKVKSADGKEAILRKTLQLNYFINGDEVYPGEDKLNVDASEWIMH